MQKRFLLALSAVLCIGAAGVGSSLSVFTDGEALTNHFSFVGEDGLDGILTEPSWKPEQGLLVLPGETIPKDPQVTNISELDIDGIAALQVEFIYGENCPEQEKAGQVLSDADMACVYDVYQIDWNADGLGDWARFDGETASNQVQRFYYKTVLERNFPDRGDTTVPLFTKLAVKREVNNRRYSRIQEMGGFDIRISGTIVQQMTGERNHGINSPDEAYKANLFSFSNDEKKR